MGRRVTGWSKISENVGMGPDVDTVHRALMASASHYVNLVDTEVTVVGIGVVTSGRYVFIVDNFVQRSGRAPAAEASTTTTTARSPATTRRGRRRPPPGPPCRRPPRPASVPAVEPPSPWLTLALEVTRGWERTAG